MEFLQSLFLELPLLTQIIVTAIAVLTCVLVLVRWNHFSVAYGPTILTMIGIFGCFLGIALGLRNFDPSRVQDSMPALLAGIKTSFWASIAGVTGALLVKFRLGVFGAPRVAEDVADPGATVDDLARLLTNLHRSIAGDEPSTLIGQTTLMRQESRDGIRALKESFDAFLQKVAENNSKALIEALKEVIRDFNAKINEQFGENFRHLNEAVGKILEWQERYRQQMTEMIEQERVSAASMKEASERYVQLVDRADIFVKVCDQLQTLLEALDGQRTQLRADLEALAKLVEGAATGIPQFEAKIIELTRQIDEGVRRNNDQWTTAGKAVTQTVHTATTELTRLLSENTSRLTQQIDEGLRKNNDQWAQAGKAVTDGMRAATGELKQLLSDNIKAANQDMNSHVRQMSDDMKKQIEVLDRTLEEELTKSINTLGRQLTALSGKFVEDYAPLVDRLRDLSRVAHEATRV